MNQAEITELLRREVIPALGCTAPVGVALAAARCRAELTGPAEEMTITLSPGIYKNGWRVAVPGTDKKGNDLGAALGLFGGDHRLGFEVLNNASDLNMAEAALVLEGGRVKSVCDSAKAGVYIEGEVRGAGESARTVIAGAHDRIERVEKNGRVVFTAGPGQGAKGTGPVDITLREIISYAQSAPAQDLAFMAEGARMNLALAEDGLSGRYGLGAGLALKKASGDRPGPATRAKILVYAASDARMGGSQLPAMSTVGSGNQGITAILPVFVQAEAAQSGEEKLCRALALSHLITFYVRRFGGRISSVCLCAVASCAGAAGAITWLKGGGEKEISAAVKNVVSTLAGLLCDGAKNSCALKMGVAAQEAFTFAELALAGAEVGYYDGISAETLDDCLANLGRVTLAAQESIYGAVVDILTAKSRANRPVGG